MRQTEGETATHKIYTNIREDSKRQKETVKYKRRQQKTTEIRRHAKELQRHPTVHAEEYNAAETETVKDRDRR